MHKTIPRSRQGRVEYGIVKYEYEYGSKSVRFEDKFGERGVSTIRE